MAEKYSFLQHPSIDELEAIGLQKDKISYQTSGNIIDIINLSKITTRWKDLCFDSTTKELYQKIRKFELTIFYEKILNYNLNNNQNNGEFINLFQEIINNNKNDMNFTNLKELDNILLLFNEDGRLNGQIPNDGNIFDHSLHQRNIIAKYGNYDYLCGLFKDKSDFQKLIILGLIHDIGEIITDDVNYLEKNQDTETQEKKSGLFLLQYLLAEFDPQLIAAYQNIYLIQYQNNDLAILFKIYEKLSYLSGAIIAYHNKDIIYNPVELIKQVFSNQIKAIDGFKDLLSVIMFFNDYKNNISEMFQFLDQLAIYEQDQQYQESRMIWFQEILPYISQFEINKNI